ncbi:MULTISPECIES: protein-disulfide reductase DsbD [Campylobacter]|uniref:protein-disulfide reductase DsbD n=2 Tax=Campylobacteraceae TaxID=72294 RepID=UPI0014702BBD|nr:MULTISPECIES: protein-disulfide reductase DsbD [Campylobacter]MBN7287709.1 protein-disulfide reductase DsbD [Campylobacter curvus]MDU6826421.1 protein-disulfide reductase DsbD [Campylobacter sp.]
MVFKILVSFFAFCLTCFGEVLDVSKAFDISTAQDSQNLEIKFKFGENIYIYQDTFEIKLNGETINSLLNMPKPESVGDHEIILQDFSLLVPFKLVGENLKDDKARLEILYQGCAKNGICYRPQSKIYTITKIDDKFSVAAADKQDTNQLSDEENIASELDSSGFLLSLATFFGYGLLLAFTPCVFPMIPILSSIIVSKSGRNLNAKTGFVLSLVYVVASSLAYALAGVAASLLGFGILGALQNVWVLSVFALFFVLLAFSMFGFYDIKLPSKFENLISKKSQNSSGLIGVFIMGFASALIVSPCVAAPLAGALLYIAQSGDTFYGGTMLFGMGLGMGVPLLVIGASSGKILPKPGAWMDGIKSLFGFLMLIMAVWLMARIFGSFFELIGYGVIGVFMAVYFGAFEVAASGAMKFKKALAILVFVYSIMLIAGGFLGSRDALSPLSGLNFTSFDQAQLNFRSVKNLNELKDLIKNADKPVMVDFYADWCASCKEIEKITFKDSAVAGKLGDFTLVRVDVTQSGEQNDAMLREFGLIDPPALLFFKGGEELKPLRTIGFISPEKFLEKISKI